MTARRISGVRFIVIASLLAASALADEAVRAGGSTRAVEAPALPAMLVVPRGRGLELVRTDGLVYRALPAKIELENGSGDSFTFHAPTGLDAVRADAHGVTLGRAMANPDAFVSWRSLTILFERELARSRAEAGALDEAAERLARARALAIGAQPADCQDFLDERSCDPAPLTYQLALVEHRRGRDGAARALLAPLAAVDEARLYHDLIRAPELAPLVELLPVRAPTPTAAPLELLRQARVLVEPRRREVAVYLPEARSTDRHPGTPTQVVFFIARHDEASWTRGGLTDWTSELTLDLDQPRTRALAARVVGELGFARDPALRGPRVDGDDYVWEAPAARATVRRSRDPSFAGCESSTSYEVDARFE